MMNITILTVGKLKESHWANAESEYLKRLKPYAKIQFEELKEEAFRDLSERGEIQKKEAAKILKKIDGVDVVVALHERGKEKTSEEFSSFLEKNSTRGEHIVFIVGGPLGLHSTVLEKANIQLSLSQLTFPHQMVRTILLEQLYRAVTIQKGKQYHY
jgi:23S rRNA (pseudouridine1915-N3)-methyltransferase